MIHLRSWSFLVLGMVACGAACSPTVSGETGDDQDTGYLPTAPSGGATNLGSGGAQFGQPSGGATGQGSAPSGSGGAGVTTGSGGSGVVTGSGGAGATETVSCIGAGAGTISAGYVDNGTICGFAWTGSFGDSPTIDPPCGTGACFTADDLCTSGTLSATDADAENYTGVMIGINAQTGASGKPVASWSAAGSIAVAFSKGGLTGEARIILQSGSTDYCVANAVSGKAYPITTFATDCWGTDGAALSAGTAIDNILVQVNGADADEAFTDFCITGVTNN